MQNHFRLTLSPPCRLLDISKHRQIRLIDIFWTCLCSEGRSSMKVKVTHYVRNVIMKLEGPTLTNCTFKLNQVSYSNHMTQLFSRIFTDHLELITPCKCRGSKEFCRTWNFRRSSPKSFSIVPFQMMCAGFDFPKSTGSSRWSIEKAAGFSIQTCVRLTPWTLDQRQLGPASSSPRTESLSASDSHCLRPVTLATDALFPSDTKPESRIQDVRGENSNNRTTGRETEHQQFASQFLEDMLEWLFLSSPF